jgi:small GTP-binding protein
MRFKVVVMGAAKVGKSSILSRFLHDKFVTHHTPTIETFHHKKVYFKARSLTLDIVDTSGEHQFIRELSSNCGDAFVLVYNIGDEQSFHEMKLIRQRLVGLTDNYHVPILVVGNMLDVKKRFVGKTMMQNFINQDWNHAYVETSAKEDINIKTAFDALASILLTSYI